MFTVIIFNYNYCNFIPGALRSLKSIINHSNFNIIFLDDGSNDDSLEEVNNLKRNLQIDNLSIISSRKKNSPKRLYPSFGQLEGFENLINNFSHLLGEKILLLDCDDEYLFDLCLLEKYKSDISNSDIIFLKVYNYKIILNKYKTLKIKRKAFPGSADIWPSITPTSGLIVSKKIVTDYKKYIFNYDKYFQDIWLDARLNILSITKNIKSCYIDLPIKRIIHSNNDSLKGGLRRFLKKQIAAYKFRNLIPEISRCRLSIRLILINTFIKLGLFNE